MGLNNQRLDDWLSCQAKTDFPYNGNVDYYKQYLSIKEYLDKNIHPHIVTATAKFEKDMYLTDHGTEHINVVIQRISKLIDVPDFKLSPYEAYLLLVATQLHDTGHFKSGREKHEKMNNEVIAELGKLIGDDVAEKRTIWQIAEAHGGRTLNGGKDKIDLLAEKTSILHLEVRQKLLAAILRFSDELADDFSRTNPSLLSSKIIDKASEIFHFYASVLNSVNIDHVAHEVNLKFCLTKEHLVNKYGKPGENGEVVEVFLIDEIFDRIYKMYLECIYCMRFVPPSIKIATINAKIEFIENNSFSEFRRSISIKLTESGYPKLVEKNLYDLCPQDLNENGSQITGEYLKNTIT